MRTYGPLLSPYWILRDGDDDRIERLIFHIEQDDYFPFLATVIGMLGDSVAKGEPSSDTAQTHMAFAKDLRNDLMYLHEHYTITPRPQKLAYTKEKVVRFGTS